MRNISNFEKIPERGRLLEGDGLVSNKVDFKMKVRPDREPVQIMKGFCDARRFLRLGYGTNCVPAGLCYDTWERILYTLQLFYVGIRYNEE